MTNLEILKVTKKPFEKDDGEMQDWAYYKAKTADGITIEFGSKNMEYEVGDNVELDLEKTETVKESKTGKKILGFRYKELS